MLGSLLGSRYKIVEGCQLYQMANNLQQFIEFLFLGHLCSMVVTDITSTSMASSSGGCWAFAGWLAMRWCDLLDHAKTHIRRAANSAQTAMPGKAMKNRGAMNAMNRHAMLIQMKREVVSGIALAAARMMNNAT